VKAVTTRSTVLGEKDPRVNGLLQSIRDVTANEEYNTALTVCDPAYEVYNQGSDAAKEVLTALGLLDDPEHKTVNWMGQRRRNHDRAAD
jgi:hypothetical protein